MLKYNLQFFAEENSDGNTSDSNNSENSNDNGTASMDSNSEGVDVEAFAELISEKDKQLEELRTEMKQLKKSNADLLVKITAQNNPKPNIEETIVDFCDTRKIK